MGDSQGDSGPAKLRIIDPFEDENDMLSRLTEEAFASVSNGRPTINLMQATSVSLAPLFFPFFLPSSSTPERLSALSSKRRRRRRLL